MVLASVGEATSAPTRADVGASTKSRASRARRQRQRGGWYCCPCPCPQALRLWARRGAVGDPCTGAGGRGGPEDVGSGAWPAPAKFYCCRADLVAAMARERTNNNDSTASRTALNRDNRLGGGGDDVLADDDDDDLLDFDEVAEEALPDATFREVFERSHEQDPDERWQVVEPDLPYVENLPHQLDAGRAIVVEGAVLPDALGFAINLCCGAGENPDIAFHLNPRLDRCYVARNSRTRGNWGEEEGAALGGSPFRRGHPFMVHILVTATDFKVSVDRMHFCSFQFRMPVSKICRLEIHGDVIVSAIKHTRLELYPERPLNALPEQAFCTIPTDHAVPWHLDIPEQKNLYIGRFKPNLSSGMEITIRGRMKLLPQSFYINLQQGCQLWPHPNVHFHLNPRFAAEDSEHVVVVNGWMHGSWGSEQRYNRCRFRPGEPFTIVIYVEEQRYRVMVDGLQQAAMFHRAPASLVDTLVIRGDLFINHVSISKSNPVPERLPSPGSPTGSLCGSFDLIPEESKYFRVRSHGNTSVDSDEVSSCQEVSPSEEKCQVPSDLKPTAVLQAAPSTSFTNNPVHSGNINSASTSESIEGKSVVSDENASSAEVILQDALPVGNRNLSLEPSSTAPGSENSSKAEVETTNPLPKAAMSIFVMAVLYGGYILRR